MARHFETAELLIEADCDLQLLSLQPQQQQQQAALVCCASDSEQASNLRYEARYRKSGAGTVTTTLARAHHMSSQMLLAQLLHAVLMLTAVLSA